MDGLNVRFRAGGINREGHDRVLLNDERVVGSSIRYLVDVFLIFGEAVEDYYLMDRFTSSFARS